jgi:carboxypeptidase family protein
VGEKMKLRRRTVYVSLCAFLLLITLNVTLWAQLPTATVNGIVKDPQGGAVVGARVVVSSKATGIALDATTSTEGQYVFTNLQPGLYDIHIEAKGFAPQDIRMFDWKLAEC